MWLKFKGKLMTGDINSYGVFRIQGLFKVIWSTHGRRLKEKVRGGRTEM